MNARNRLTLLLLVLVVSLLLWYATFRMLGLTGSTTAVQKTAPKPVPEPVKLAEPAWDRIDLQQVL